MTKLLKDLPFSLSTSKMLSKKNSSIIWGGKVQVCFKGYILTMVYNLLCWSKWI